VVGVVGDLFKEEDSLDRAATNDGIFNLTKLVMISIHLGRHISVIDSFSQCNLQWSGKSAAPIRSGAWDWQTILLLSGILVSNLAKTHCQLDSVFMIYIAFPIIALLIQLSTLPQILCGPDFPFHDMPEAFYQSRIPDQFRIQKP
jgi:hypothetical protein